MVLTSEVSPETDSVTGLETELISAENELSISSSSFTLSFELFSLETDSSFGRIDSLKSVPLLLIGCTDDRENIMAP